MYARCLAATVVLALSFDVAFTDAPKADDAKDIQGMWRIVSFKGTKAPSPEKEEEIIRTVRVRITKDELIFVVGGKEESPKIPYRIRSDKKPKEFDWIEVTSLEKGPNAGKAVEKAQPGIYQLIGDDLKICVNFQRYFKMDKDKGTDPGKPAVRPGEFTAADNNLLLILKRDK